MAEIISLIFLCVGVLAFTREIKLFKIVSSIMLYFSFVVTNGNVPLQVSYISIMLMVLIVLLYVSSSKKNKDIFYFSIPCWLLIFSVIYKVFIYRS